MKENIIGKYQFEIKKDGKYYIAHGRLIAGTRGSLMITQGMSKREIFEMIADAYLTIFDIPVKK